MDFISVVIPAFNAERWLEKTLDSVAAAIDKDCEVIIVNDGSTDGTADIARRFTDRDPRFVLINIDHVGPCAARRAGFLESQGDYIVFVDSDDYLPHTSISEQRRLLNSSARDIRDDGDGVQRHTDGRPKIIIANTLDRHGDKKHLLISGSTRALTGLEYAVEILTGVLPGFLPGHFYAREVIEAIDWDDSPEITHQENFYLLLSFAMKLNEEAPDKRQVLVVPSVIGYHHVLRAGSQSAMMALTPRGLERVWHHINQLGLPEPELTRWGLELLYRAFIERGIPFPTRYSVAADLHRRGMQLREHLDDKHIEILGLLGSLKKRTATANKLAREAGLTSVRPHLSVVVVCHHNVAKVQRTVASLFAMGFRNLEAIVIDHGNTHSERVALNQLTIKYARVRIITLGADESLALATFKGLHSAEGLCVAYVRPGDLCCAAGLYDGVTRIDYGADAVLSNLRDYSPSTRLRGKVWSYSFLRSTPEARNAQLTAADAGDNVADELRKILVEDTYDESTDTPLVVYGTIWRTDFLKEHYPVFKEAPHRKLSTISFNFLRRMLDEPSIRIVTQDNTSTPTFEIFNDRFFTHRLGAIFPGGNRRPFKSSAYRKR